LDNLIEDYVNKNKNSKKAFYKSFVKFYKSAKINYINHQNDNTIIKEASNTLKKIDYFLNNTNLLELLAWINTNDLVSWGSPIIWKIQGGMVEPDIFRSYIYGPKLTLLDMRVYFDDGTNLEYKKIYRNEYILFLGNLFEYFFGKDHGFNVKDIFNVETKIANAYACSKNTDSFKYNFSKITQKESIEKYNFDWEKYCNYLGFQRNPEFYYTNDPDYIKCIFSVLFKEWNTKEWRTYWIYIFIRMIGRFNDTSSHIYYNFNEIFQKGSESRSNFNLLMIIPLSYAFNTFLSKEYVKKYKNNNYLNYAKLLSEDLKKVFVRILKRNSWLEPLTTKRRAIEKINYIKIIIGFPNEYIPDPILDYDDNNIWLNLVKVSNYYHKQNIKLEGKKYVDLSIMDWSQIPAGFSSIQTYNVNAFYTPSRNSIYIPLGYLQKPFIDLNQRIFIYNLAYLGLTIAHEMAHALDEWGRQFDKYGKLNDWWTIQDKKEFYKIEEDIVKQLETYALRDGIKYDGWLNIGELIADIVGFTICREYLRDYLYINNSIYQASELSFQLFFTLVALQFRQKINKVSVSNEVKTNPHPLGKYRCNVIFSRSKIFREIYNVKKGDGMWWPITNRVWEN
jgi:putative endopeptidase